MTRMKQYFEPARNIFFIMLTALALIVFISSLQKPKEDVPINSHAIAQYMEIQAVREILSPSVFSFKAELFAYEKDPETQKENKSICVEGTGAAFTVSENGYFLTNNHNVDIPSKQNTCLEGLARMRNTSISSLSHLRFEIRYTLTDPKNISFPVVVAEIFPKKDVALLKVSLGNAPKTLPEKWIPVNFRTGSPNIVKGKVIPGKGTAIIPDEPVATMGSPLLLPFTITMGKLGNNAFLSSQGETLIHFIAPINSGNSGGPLVSLLDFKVIGMVTMSRKDGANMSQQSGAVPYWVIEDILKNVTMK